MIASVLALAILGTNVRLVAGGKTWDDARYHTEIAPPRLAAAEQVQHGTLPAWWDGTGLGVPLAGEPSHGALYPPTWLASTPRSLDWLALLHLWWAALGVAVWARRSKASEPAALVAGLLVATTGILASAAVRGALPAIAHLPWIGFAAAWLADAGRKVEDARSRARRPAHEHEHERGKRVGTEPSREEVAAKREGVKAAIALAAALGAIGLAGSLAILVDAVVLAVAIAGNRRVLPQLAIALGCGLAIAAAQWVPAVMFLQTPRVGAEVAGLPLQRLLELLVPGSFGSADPDRALPLLAGDLAWAPSMFVGAPLLALAAVRTPAGRVLAVIGLYAALVLVVGRGGWPHWLGAPELHLAALVVVLGAHAGVGIDAFVAGERRALFALAAGAACAAVALGALGAQHAKAPSAIEPALVHGGIGVACMALALVLVWKLPRRAVPVVLALLVLPSVGPAPAIAPVTDRTRVAEPPSFAARAHLAPPRAGPRRVYRPVSLVDRVRDRADVYLPHGKPALVLREDLSDLLATLAGSSAWKWGIAAARSDDPARTPDHDRTWIASANEGGALLDRFGIAYAILPATLVAPRKFRELDRRGDWALVWLDVAPAASVVRGWSWAVAPEDALALLYPMSGGTGVLRGTVVLRGGGTSQIDRGPPLPCTVDRWTAGDIALACTTPVDGYAVISSATAPGWRVTVDEVETEWLTADVIRRAVPVSAGTHHVAWTYEAPGLRLGILLAVAGLALLVALAIVRPRR